jgi:F0F1-type ATP synthase membrane subunit b/b'
MARRVERAAAEAGIVDGATRRATRIQEEALFLLEEARAERNEAARLRLEAKSELEAADQTVTEILAEAQETLDQARHEADDIVHDACARAWFEAHLILSSARSRARLLTEESEIFSWES